MEEEKKENVEKVNNEAKTEVKTEKKKKSKKGLIVAIIAIVLVIIVGVSIFVGYHATQLATLTEEVNQINLTELLESDGTINKEATIDMEIKTSGSYAVVEETLKNYLNETLELGKQAEDIISEDELQNLVSFENIKNDAPDFVQIKAKIAEMKKSGEEYIDKFITLCNKDNMLSAIEGKGVSEYYKELYKKLAIDENDEKELDEAIEELNKARNQITVGFEYIENMVNFLSEHKSDWTIQGNQIMFYKQSVLDEYQKIVSNTPEEIK